MRLSVSSTCVWRLRALSLQAVVVGPCFQDSPRSSLNHGNRRDPQALCCYNPGSQTRPKLCATFSKKLHAFHQVLSHECEAATTRYTAPWAERLQGACSTTPASTGTVCIAGLTLDCVQPLPCLYSNERWRCKDSGKGRLAFDRSTGTLEVHYSAGEGLEQGLGQRTS